MPLTSHPTSSSWGSVSVGGAGGAAAGAASGGAGGATAGAASHGATASAGDGSSGGGDVTAFGVDRASNGAGSGGVFWR